MEEGKNLVISKLKTARSALDECCYFTENEILEEEISEIENRVTDIIKSPEEAPETSGPNKRIRVPPTTDKEVYERWLNTLSESDAEKTTHHRKSTSTSSNSEREKTLRVPPTTEDEIYKRWLETL